MYQTNYHVSGLSLPLSKNNKNANEQISILIIFPKVMMMIMIMIFLTVKCKVNNYLITKKKHLDKKEKMVEKSVFLKDQAMLNQSWTKKKGRVFG